MRNKPDDLALILTALKRSSRCTVGAGFCSSSVFKGARGRSWRLGDELQGYKEPQGHSRVLSSWLWPSGSRQLSASTAEGSGTLEQAAQGGVSQGQLHFMHTYTVRFSTWLFPELAQPWQE